MKKTIFLKTVFTLLMCGFFSMSSAATIYLSSTGVDTNDGLSAATAVKTFQKAHDLANAGDTVMVSGMIDFAAEVVLAKNLIIMGTSNTTAGFDGKNLVQLIKTAGFNLSLSNLKLTGGLSAGNGGAMVITGGTVTITNVVFEANAAAIRGGAISIEPSTTLTLNLNNCVIKNNSASTDAAAYYYVDAPGTTNTVTFTNCALISNTATLTGAGGYINNNASATLQISYINCTIAKNSSGGNSSAGLFVGNLQATSNLVLTNCTMTENVCQTAATSGAGIRVATAVNTNGAKVKLYNTIIENNYYPTTATTTTTSGWTTDFVWQGDGFTPGTNLIIENSIIGRPMAASNIKWLVATNSFPTSKYNYVTAASGNCTDSYIAKFNAFNATTNSYSLANDSFALAYGLTSWLGTGTVLDQLNFPRPTPNCSAGSIEKNPSGPALGVQKMDNKDSFVVFKNTSNKIVISDASEDTVSSISVYNSLGQLVYKTQSEGVVTTIEKSFNAGLYLVSIQKGGATITKKVILN